MEYHQSQPFWSTSQKKRIRFLGSIEQKDAGELQFEKL
jgi:hypothetical protein